MLTELISCNHTRHALRLVWIVAMALTAFSGSAHASYTDCATDWDNFLPPTGYTKPYTYLGQPVYDHESSSDPTYGSAPPATKSIDLASGSPNGSDPGPFDTPSYGYYNGGTEYDPDDPSTIEDDYVLFTMRLAGDPRTVKEDFDAYHWNVLLDVDDDGYKEYWIDLFGGYSQKDENEEYYDSLQILYDNNNRQDIPDPDAEGVRVDAFRAYNGTETCASTPCALSQNCSFTRVREADDGTGDYWIDIQVPMTAFKDSEGNQVLFPDSAVGFVFSTSNSNTDPLQKDFMADLEFLSLNDPINFGDVVNPNGDPDLYFADVDLEQVEFYSITEGDYGDDIYLYLMDPLANDDPDAVETVTATVQDPVTGDDETVTLTESGPNSGIFTNLGGASLPVSDHPSNVWIPYVQTAVITDDETWTVTYNASAGTYTVTGSVSGEQTAVATAGTEYTSDDGAVTFTLYEDNPADEYAVTFNTYAGDQLQTHDTAGTGDDDGILNTDPGHMISYSYTNEKSKTVTDTAQMLGSGEPFIQFTRATGLPADEFELGEDLLYVTVYHADSNTDAGTVQTIQVVLSGNDAYTMTLTETGPDTGIFRNMTGLETQVEVDPVDTTDSIWEDLDSGEVTATFTYGGIPFSTTATLFYTDDAGRVYFMNGAGTQDIELYSAGRPVFLKVVDDSAFTCPGEPMAVTVTSFTGDSEVVILTETAAGSGVYMNRQNDLTTVAGSADVTATSGFSGVSEGDFFVIATGPDTGTYTVSAVVDTDTLTLSEHLGYSRTDIGYNANPLMTATYTGSYTQNDGILTASDADTLTVTYHDCTDGDADTTNDHKTDTASYNAPPIVINQVLFYTDTTTIGYPVEREYIELYNASAAPYAMTGCRVTDEDGDLNYTIPQYEGDDIVLNPGESLYIVLVANASPPDDYTNASGTYTYYLYATVSSADVLGDPDTTDTADQVSLYDSTGTIIDYVGWSTTNDNSLDFKSDDENAVAQVIWQDNNYKDVADDPITKSYSMYRCSDGVDTDTTDDWCYKPDSINDIIITAATISGFLVYEDGGLVVVEWETASEIRTAGFYIFRAEHRTGPYSQLNETLLPALIHAQQGGSYRFIDETALSGETYAYKIIEVETTGKRITHGPFVVTVGLHGTASRQEVGNDPSKTSAHHRFTQRIGDREREHKILNASEVSDLYGHEEHPIPEDKLARLQDGRLSRLESELSRGWRTGDRLKMVVNQDGLYYLDAADISDLLGLSSREVRNLIRRTCLSLTNGGEQVAYLRAEGDAGIYFYGQGIESIYTDENIYWLTPDKGEAMRNVRSRKRLLPSSDRTFTRTVHEEEDLFPTTGLFSDPEQDYWLWDYVIAGGNQKEFVFQADGVSDGPHEATLVLYLKGITDDPEVAPDHHVVVSVNGIEIFPFNEPRWDGTDAHEVVFSFDQRLLDDGENSVEIYGLLDAGAAYSLFGIDSFDLSYRSVYRAHDDKLLFRGEGNRVVTVSGFTDSCIVVLDLSDRKRPKRLQTSVEESSEGFSVTINPAQPDVPYFAATTRAAISDLRIWADKPSTLSAPNNMADYIVIFPAELKDGAQRLADYRETQGLYTMAAELEDIMDEFNEGIYSPHALKTFLGYAYEYWRVPPAYVVLVGDGTFDYKDNLGYGDNLLPPLLVNTPDGLFASDNRFVDVKGNDGVPEMSIGRLPVLTADELDTLVDKIIEYENSSGDWTKRVIMLADDPDRGGDFPSDSDDVVNVLPRGYAPERIYLSDLPIGVARQRVLGGIDRGAVLVNYIGHGGLDRLASEGLLLARDVDIMENGPRLPIVTAMTCMVGRFAMPGYDCLAEALIRKNDGGAVAVWAPTGGSINAEAKVLDKAFVIAALGNEGMRLGAAVLTALQVYGSLRPERSMLDIYNLMGDPAIQIK